MMLIHMSLCIIYVFMNSHLRLYYILPIQFCVSCTILCILRINTNRKKSGICEARCGMDIDFCYNLKVELLFVGHMFGRSFLQTEEGHI